MKSNKILWLDVETTGLDSKKNGIIQIAAIYTRDLDGPVISTFEGTCSAKGFDIEKEALEVNGIDKKDLKKRRPPIDLLDDFVKWMQNFIDPYDRNDKFFVAGYNARFDVGFVNNWAKNLGFNYVMSYFGKHPFDMMLAIRWMELEHRIGPFDSLKLTEVAKAFNVKLDGHDAMEDIKATRELFFKLKEVMS